MPPSTVTVYDLLCPPCGAKAFELEVQRADPRQTDVSGLGRPAGVTAFPGLVASRRPGGAARPPSPQATRGGRDGGERIGCA